MNILFSPEYSGTVYRGLNEAQSCLMDTDVLDAYAAAMTSAGETVTHRMIYYPVSGLLVEVSEPTTSNQ